MELPLALGGKADQVFSQFTDFGLADAKMKLLK